ncbi:MAG: hypothetical protein L0Z53_27535 [Acidobacteriales bacterium]|nr:hypothetical protein [Terriglobales bacterium]
MENSFNPNFLIAALLFLAFFAVLVLLGWGRQAWMPKAATIVIRGIVGFLGALVLVGTIWFTWEFRPWMQAGRTVHLISERIGDYEFQVWQRKNASVGEPFATGLFVRKQGGGPWQAFLLDFEDIYRPNIVLRKEGSKVAILYDNEKWGDFDEQRQVFLRRYSDGDYPLDPLVIASEPPGDWWLKESLVH